MFLKLPFSRPRSVQVVGYDEKVDQKAELTEINSDERVFALGKNSLPNVAKPLGLVKSCTEVLTFF
jgi:hypothetical protein